MLTFICRSARDLGGKVFAAPERGSFDPETGRGRMEKPKRPRFPKTELQPGERVDPLNPD